ncbi:MAG: GntR family transcriptional regulator [Acidimicrobiia bacterium]|nr:GntR family transcriptional regulator [Acidimicrobiia bacterium]
MPAQLTRIRRPRAVDAVYEVLRERILSSQFKPGERLHIDELSTKLGVSLTPVQHAIHQLAAEGLVEVRPRKGTFVARLSPQHVEETFEIRTALECLAAEQAVERITEEELQRVRQLLEALGKPVRTPEDRKAHERDNSEFHRAIIQASGNQRLSEMYEELNAHLQIGRIHAGSDDGTNRLAQEHEEHRQIVAALERRDAPALVPALRQHILRAKNALTASLRATSEQQAP